VPVVPWEPPPLPGALDQLANFYHAVLTFEHLVCIGLNITTTINGRKFWGRRKVHSCTPRENLGYAYEKRAPPYVVMGPPNG